MSQATLAPTPVETQIPRKPGMKHFVCPCQIALGDTGHAYCGVRVAGKAMSHRDIPPMDLCVICGDFKTDQRPCPSCGRPADGWSD